MRLFRRRSLPTREDIRRAIPQKNPQAVESDAVLSIPVAKRKGLLGWLARKANSPVTHEIELDEIGLFVWSLIDGKRNVAGIAESLSKQYKLNKHESEASLLEFIDRLRRRGCLTLRRK